MSKQKKPRWINRVRCSVGLHCWIYSPRPDYKLASPVFKKGEHFYRKCLVCPKSGHIP